MFEVGKVYVFNSKDKRYYKGKVMQVTDTHVIFKGKFGIEGLALDNIKEFREDVTTK